MASSDDAKLPCDKRTLQGDLLEVLRRSGFHDAAATLEDLRAQEHLERRKLGDGKKFALAWAQIVAAVVRDGSLFGERAREDQLARLKGACHLPSRSSVGGNHAGSQLRIDANGRTGQRGHTGNFWTTAPDMARPEVREHLEHALDKAAAAAVCKFACKGCSPPSLCVTTAKCEEILRPLLDRDPELRHMLNAKKFPMRLRILADITRLRVTWPEDYTKTTLRPIPKNSHFRRGADAICAGPTPDAELDFVVVRGKLNSEFRPFAKPSVDLARILAAIASETADEVDEFSGSKQAQSKARSRVYKRAWHSGYRAPPHLDRKTSVRNLFYEPAAPSARRARLNEELRCTLEKIYQEARPYLYAQLLPHEMAKLAFNMQDWLGEGRTEAPSVPLLAAVWLDLGAILAHVDDDPGLAFMVACAWGSNDETVGPPRKRARAQSRAHGQNVRGSGFYFPASGPEGIYVSLRQGDILLFNPSAPHCATEPWYESDDPGWFSVRSLVSCYLNRDMIGAARAAQKIAPG